MKEFNEYKGPYIHTKETYKNRIISYLIVFIPFFVYTIYTNTLTTLSTIIYPIIFTLLPIIIVGLLETIYKFIFIKTQSTKKYLKENFTLFSILFFPFLLNIKTPLYIVIISIIIGYILYKTIFKKWYSLTILSYIMYLILSLITKTNLEQLSILPITYNNLITTNKNFINLILNGSGLMSPIITLLSFIYLIIKKDIKKEITISSIITILFITTIIGLTKKAIWFPFYFILTGGTLFITIILANDFYSPATKKGKIMYGIFIGLILTILRFISPYNVTPLSIFLANTFTFTFDYINEFINKKIIMIIEASIIIITTIIITILI